MLLKRYQEDMRRQLAKKQRVQERLSEYQAELMRRIEAAQARLAEEQARTPDVVLAATGLSPRTGTGSVPNGAHLDKKA